AMKKGGDDEDLSDWAHATVMVLRSGRLVLLSDYQLDNWEGAMHAAQDAAAVMGVRCVRGKENRPIRVRRIDGRVLVDHPGHSFQAKVLYSLLDVLAGALAIIVLVALLRYSY
ncbi:MAG: hypothetical protein JRH20_31380, partial [Deltaproteobacteria bacterium]|nr:hypothetical protein [Deltaproteobacteria bacterium]